MLLGTSLLICVGAVKELNVDFWLTLNPFALKAFRGQPREDVEVIDADPSFYRTRTPHAWEEDPSLGTSSSSECYCGVCLLHKVCANEDGVLWFGNAPVPEVNVNSQWTSLESVTTKEEVYRGDMEPYETIPIFVLSKHSTKQIPELLLPAWQTAMIAGYNETSPIYFIGPKNSSLKGLGTIIPHHCGDIWTGVAPIHRNAKAYQSEGGPFLSSRLDPTFSCLPTQREVFHRFKLATTDYKRFRCPPRPHPLVVMIFAPRGYEGPWDVQKVEEAVKAMAAPGSIILDFEFINKPRAISLDIAIVTPGVDTTPLVYACQDSHVFSLSGTIEDLCALDPDVERLVKPSHVEATHICPSMSFERFMSMVQAAIKSMEMRSIVTTSC